MTLSSLAPFDLVLKQGRVMDPAAGIDRVCDIGIRGGRIARVGDLGAAEAGRVIDCRGKLVLPGMIDTHAHVFEHVTGRFGLPADLCGVHSAVTTLVDQGGPSCITLPAFRHFIAERAQSRVLAFLSAYLVGGMEGHFYDSLYRPDCLDVDATVKAAVANRDMVRGIKAHAELGGYSRWGLEVMQLAARIGREAELPVYIHFGQLWPPLDTSPVDPDSILPSVVELIKPGDVLAHPFSRHPGGVIGRNGRLHPFVHEAIARGATLDVGHGSHFSFRAARIVLEAGVVPDTLGADMHGYNTRLPDEAPVEAHLFGGKTQFSLAFAMSEMLALGVPLERVVRMVSSASAAMIGMQDELGSLAEGRVADVSVLEDLRGRWMLADNEGTQVPAERMLAPAFCLKGGERFEADAAILPVLDRLAA